MPKTEKPNPRAKIGDNSGADDDDDFLDTSPAKMAEAHDKRLSLLIERVERLEEEKKGIADDIRDVYAEAKAVGYDAKIMRQIVRLRKMKPDDRAEMEPAKL
jgi:uncharacterized protein (UPF0335 family)